MLNGDAALAREIVSDERDSRAYRRKWIASESLVTVDEGFVLQSCRFLCIEMCLAALFS